MFSLRFILSIFLCRVVGAEIAGVDMSIFVVGWIGWIGWIGWTGWTGWIGWTGWTD
jgi:hypothetical protein